MTIYCTGLNYRKLAQGFKPKAEFNVLPVRLVPQCVVYIWSRGHQCLYVGSTKHLYKRVFSHHLMHPKEVLAEDEIIYVLCKSPVQMKVLEVLFIRELYPILNTLNINTGKTI